MGSMSDSRSHISQVVLKSEDAFQALRVAQTPGPGVLTGQKLPLITCFWRYCVAQSTGIVATRIYSPVLTSWVWDYRDYRWCFSFLTATWALMMGSGGQGQHCLYFQWRPNWTSNMPNDLIEVCCDETLLLYYWTLGNINTANNLRSGQGCMTYPWEKDSLVLIKTTHRSKMDAEPDETKADLQWATHRSLSASCQYSPTCRPTLNIWVVHCFSYCDSYRLYL